MPVGKLKQQQIAFNIWLHLPAPRMLLLCCRKRRHKLPERTAEHSKYSSIDDKIDDFHYFTTFIKFGIGRATYDSAQEIRNGEIERDEAIQLISRFDGEYPSRFENEIFSYLSINANEFPIASKMFEQPEMSFDYFMRLTDQHIAPYLAARE